jgi:hypothetical protein
MMKAPTSNIQHPKKLQIPLSKLTEPRALPLEVGVWNFSGCWMLEFGISIYV